MPTTISPSIRIPIRILLADDREIMLYGLKKMINEENPKMVVVGTSTNGDDAKQLVKDKQPDILLLKTCLDGQDSVQSIPDLTIEGQTRVIVLTHINDSEIIDRAVLNGARGIVHEKETKLNILKAIRKIHAGELWIDRNTTSRILTQHYSHAKKTNAADLEAEKIITLTRKEILIVKTFAQLDIGAQNKKIAKKLYMSESTLRNHLTSIFSKLEIKNRYELFVLAKRNHLQFDSPNDLEEPPKDNLHD